MTRLILLALLFTLAILTNAQVSYDITFTHADKTVYGTIIVPDSSGQFPTVIINPGTGANDRDGTIEMVGANIVCLYPDLLNNTLKPYKQLGDALVDAGYAVLRYDKLEYTYAAPATLGEISFHKLWLPVESAIDYVKTRDDVDTNNIVLLGHSEGSYLIPHIAKGREDVRALVSVAGPSTPFDSLLAYQIVYITDTCNGNVALAQAQANQVLNYFDIIRTNNWNSGTPPFAGVSASVWYDYIRVIDSVTSNYNQVNLPSLFTGLSLDFNVPLEELDRFANEVTITDDFWSISGLNHYMTPNDNPNVSKVLTDTIIHWLDQQIMNSGLQIQEAEPIYLDVFPNPFRSEITIDVQAREGKHLDISICNVFGQQLLSEEYSLSDGYFSQTYPTDGFEMGIYLITISLDGHRETRKVIKQ